MRAVALTLGVFALSGCLDLGAWEELDRACDFEASFRTWTGGDRATRPSSVATDPRQAVDLLVLMDVRPRAPDANVTVTMRPQSADGGTWDEVGNRTGFHRLHLALPTPTTTGTTGLDVAAQVRVTNAINGSTCSNGKIIRDGSFPTVVLPASEEGDIAHAGQGVWVHTTGFLPNGSVFYSTRPVEPSWPRLSWFEQPTSAQPIRVYVYDKSRDERPAYWNVTSPTDVPVVGNTDMDYFTTIEGFNEGLKGLSTTTSKVVVIPPEKAYTRPGREQHPLYGQTLVFHIDIDQVFDMPCPMDSPLPDVTCVMPAP